MDSKVITVDRKTLYEQAWNTPMWKLAKNYGLSDVGLAKICRKLNIPLPPRGYWRKKEAGKAANKPPLPELTAPELRQATIPLKKTKDEKLSENVQRQLEFEQNPVNKILVPAHLSKLHPLLKTKQDILLTAKPDEYGMLCSKEVRSLNLRVSKTQLPRALRNLNALYHSLELRGFRVTKTKDENSKNILEIHNEQLEVGIEEKTKRNVRNEKDRKQSDPWWTYQKYEYQPTGLLCLRIKEYLKDGLRQSWGDGKTQRIEELMNDFIIGLVKAAEDRKRERLERERWHREWQEKERRRVELERKRLEEQERIQLLRQDAADWAKAKQIQEYLSEMKKIISSKDCAINIDSKMEAWFSWAIQYSEQLNPLTRVVDAE